MPGIILLKPKITVDLCMVFIVDGSSENMWTETGSLICVRYFFVQFIIQFQVKPDFLYTCLTYSEMLYKISTTDLNSSMQKNN